MNEKEREAKRELNNCWKDAAVLLLLLLLLLKPYTIRCASVCAWRRCISCFKCMNTHLALNTSRKSD